MKRILIFILIFWCFFFCFTGCTKNDDENIESVENYINLWTTMSEYNIKYWKDCLVLNESYINQEITLKEFKKQKHLIDLSYGYTYE